MGARAYAVDHEKWWEGIDCIRSFGDWCDCVWSSRDWRSGCRRGCYWCAEDSAVAAGRGQAGSAAYRALDGRASGDRKRDAALGLMRNIKRAGDHLSALPACSVEALAAPTSFVWR